MQMQFTDIDVTYMTEKENYLAVNFNSKLAIIWI